MIVNMARHIETAEIIRRINTGESETAIGRSVGISGKAIYEQLENDDAHPQPPEGYITVKEFAQLYKIGSYGVTTLINRGKLSGLKFKGKWYIRKDAFLACAKCGRPREWHKHYCADCGKAMLMESHRKSGRRQYYSRIKVKELLEILGDWLKERFNHIDKVAYVSKIEIETFQRGKMPESGER